MERSETHYVSFLGNEDVESNDGGRRGSEGSRTYQRRYFSHDDGRHDGALRRGFERCVVTTRTYFWKKLLRNPRLRSRVFLALIALAVSLLLLGVFLVQWQQQQQGGLDENVLPSHLVDIDDTPSKTPVNIWDWREEHFLNEFSGFQAKYGKTYASKEERDKRYAIYKSNLIYIHTHNQQGFSYTLKMNQFGDLTREEFRQKYLGYRKTHNYRSHHLGVANELLRTPPSDSRNSTPPVPSSVDWREKGCVTPVKDQKDCGSCWAFSSTGALEGAYCSKTGILISLSEQQLMDCSGPEGNESCNGGEMPDAFQYVIDNGGICSESAYPYLAKDDPVCHSKSCKNVVSIKGFKMVPQKSEVAMKRALAQYGPVSIAIEADQTPFQFYHEGIFDSSCGTDLDHGVLLVGYHDEAGEGEEGEENLPRHLTKKTKDYWIMKNSWGSDWGSNGYMLMAMHKGDEGQCGLLLDGSFPIV